jgi:hypothetical protein
MTPHTPGPWETNGLTIETIAGPFVVVAHVADTDGAGPDDTGECHANARLIAHAPALLTLINRMQRFCPVTMQDEVRAILRAVEGE